MNIFISIVPVGTGRSQSAFDIFQEDILSDLGNFNPLAENLFVEVSQWRMYTLVTPSTQDPLKYPSPPLPPV